MEVVVEHDGERALPGVTPADGGEGSALEWVRAGDPDAERVRTAPPQAVVKCPVPLLSARVPRRIGCRGPDGSSGSLADFRPKAS